MSEKFLVTGALGFIGAWTIRTLVRDGVEVVGFDLAAEPRRLKLLMKAEELNKVTLVGGDITNLVAMEHALDEHGITHVVHLAALQVPFCRDDPPLGAKVNVVGTVNVLEAVQRRAEKIRGVVYTSSIGMFDAADADPTTGRLRVDATAHPTNHYGVFKHANEGNARVYWLEHGLSSIGVRPMTVFGPGRDQGLTSDPTKAILAALLGRHYRIGFGGRTLFQYAEDVARTLVQAARSGLKGAHVFNLTGSLASIVEYVEIVDQVIPGATKLLGVAEESLPFPEEIETTGLEQLGPVQVTPLEVGIRTTAETFCEQIAAGRMTPSEHGLV
ncbi:MAG: NAD-dependent epimerase/dehydratase family protein [Acidimicrobiia bacterium]